MTLRVYRIYHEQVLMDDLWGFRCTSPGEALKEADLVGEPGVEAIELPKTIESECVCSENGELRTFVALKYDYPGEWLCQNCQRVYVLPPDEINWEHQRWFDAGYIPCPTCDSYKFDCPYCQGAGWWKPGGETDDDD